MFIKNLAASDISAEDRPGGFYVAHSALIVVVLGLFMLTPHGYITPRHWTSDEEG